MSQGNVFVFSSTSCAKSWQLCHNHLCELQGSGAPLKSCASVRLRRLGEELCSVWCGLCDTEAAPAFRISLSVVDGTGLLGIKCRPCCARGWKSLSVEFGAAPFSRGRIRSEQFPSCCPCLRACSEGRPEEIQSPVHHKT